MRRILFALYSVVCYAVFFGTFLYAVGFVADVAVPRTLDQGPTAPLGIALAIDAGLLMLFALQHSVMARRGFKKWWTRIVPPEIERSTYVLAASVALLVLFWQWRPIGGTLWTLHGPAATALTAVSLAGWGLVLVSTFVIDHFELFGLRQAWGASMPAPKLSERAFYGIVRHPLYLGFAIAFWATPHMTAAHLVFAVATLGYMLVAIQFEERDLVHVFGEEYREYRRRVPMIAPIPVTPAPRDTR